MYIPGAFDSGSNVLASNLEDGELSINVFPESGQVGTPKITRYTRHRPGLRFLFKVNDSPVECLFEINGRAFGVAGTAFFEFFQDDTYLIRGAVAHDGIDLATMCSSGTASNQILIIAGTTGYVYDLLTDTLTAIADPDFPTFPVMCEFFAGYFFVLLRNSTSIQWSALEDATSWDALDVYTRSWASDNINFIKRNGTHIWVVGNRTSEVLYATGGVDVFAPAQESLIEHGAVARFSGARTAQGILCLDQDERGVGMVVLYAGLQPQPVSTYAINLEQQSPAAAGVLNASWAYAVQSEGHVFYVLNNVGGILNNPTDAFTLTPVLDMTESLWHHWAHWDSVNASWIPWRGLCHCDAFESHFIGDRETGAVYDFAFENVTDELVTM